MESARLRLRRFTAHDFENLRELESDAEVMKFTSLRVALSAEQTASRLQSLIEKETERAPLGVWALELKDDADFVGWFMLLKTKTETPELGFMIVRRHWGKGYTTEGSRLLVDYAFHALGFSKLTATTDPLNEASKKVLLKLGFSWMRQENGLDIFEITKL
ncbi:hypothetical protein AZI86_13230 [Bdellovibrio bacteriovorus]|uniref:N-acetyltransferase domain-containing protein n=1 Tax=Bdellovibrio bacteriovorus TaxID=959 RepID=A0A150WJA7_BDEBC|nr:GNAT family N-acetyltransferase [Bdellovibrio bacteriovorus]KYG63780.1 hypothetical protein AZI86_13230 [Bdellovibrio bacteriovorus]